MRGTEAETVGGEEKDVASEPSTPLTTARADCAAQANEQVDLGSICGTNMDLKTKDFSRLASRSSPKTGGQWTLHCKYPPPSNQNDTLVFSVHLLETSEMIFQCSQ